MSNTLDILGDVIGLGDKVFSSVFNTINASDLYELQKEQFEYQKNLQQQIFQREDNAVQRRVADLTAAGLSPILAAGSAANAGAVVSTTAPKESVKYASALSDLVGKHLSNQVRSEELDIAKAEQDVDNAKKTGDLIAEETRGKAADADLREHDAHLFTSGEQPLLSQRPSTWQGNDVEKYVTDIVTLIRDLFANYKPRDYPPTMTTYYPSKFLEKSYTGDYSNGYGYSYYPVGANGSKYYGN